jgi:hypothetical protein
VTAQIEVQLPLPTSIAIDLSQSWQAAWWADRFGVTRAELLVAIVKAGTDADAVRNALGK